MRNLASAFRAEWLRLSTGRSAWLLPLSAVLGGGYAFSLGVAAERGLFGAPAGFYLAAAGATGAAITCAAVGALLAASGVGSDFGSGVARSALCRPVGRTAWLLARLASLACGVVLVFLGASLGALLMGWARFGLGSVTEGSYVLASGGLLAVELAVAVATAALGTTVSVAAGGVLGMLWGRSAPAVASVAVLGAALLALGRGHAWSRCFPTRFSPQGWTWWPSSPKDWPGHMRRTWLRGPCWSSVRGFWELLRSECSFSDERTSSREASLVSSRCLAGCDGERRATAL